jgi:hypothetical protein
MEDLKLIRKYVNSKELKEKYNLENSYKTIEAVLYGLRKNNHILELALKLAKENVLKDLLQLQEIKIEQKADVPTKIIHKKTDNRFENLSIDAQWEHLRKIDRVVHLQELKKDLIQREVFYNLDAEIQGFLKNPSAKNIKALRLFKSMVKLGF